MSTENTELPLKEDVQTIQEIPIVPSLLNVICRTTGMGFAAVARVTNERWITCLAQDEIGFGLKPGDELKVETTICHEIWQNHQAVIINNVDADKNFCNHHTPAMYGFKSYISVPIFRKDGSFFGTLCAIDPNPAVLNTPETKDMFYLFADLIAFHLQALEQLEESKLNLFKEREERTKMLEQKNDELQTLNKELESFAYVASHDLQEPLRKIKTFSTKLQVDEIENLSEHGKQYFTRLLKAVTRMQQLIEDLLAYTKIDIHKRAFEITNVAKILKEIKQDYKDDLTKKKITIDIGNMCDALIIPFQIQQVFQNLISNSIKFSRQGVDAVIQINSVIEKGNISINNKLSANKDYCHITISDNGIGFDPVYKDQIFKIFQRLHGKNEYEGTGIGLAIVKRIIDNHHGIIHVDSKENAGTKFDIYLPQEQ